jgi:flagellar assembly protein FliH
MSRLIRDCEQPTAAVFGSIDLVATVERQRLFGPAPEPIEVQVARYQASEEAHRLVAEAFEAAKSIHEEAHRAGSEAGWAAGYAEGRAAAEAEAAAETEAFRAAYRAELAQVLSRIEQETLAQWMDAEAQIVGLSLEIARKVVKLESAINPEVIVEVVKNALRRHVSAGDGETVRIRVNSADLENVRAARADILTVIDGVRGVDIVEDRRTAQGGCVVETASGIIDANIDTQFRTIEESFLAARDELRAGGRTSTVGGETAAGRMGGEQE